MLKHICEEIRRDDEVAAKSAGKSKSKFDSIQHYAFLRDIECENIERKQELLEKYHYKPPEFSIEKQRLNDRKEKFSTLCKELELIKIKVLKYENHKDYRKWLNKIHDEIIEAKKEKEPIRNVWRPEDE